MPVPEERLNARRRKLLHLRRSRGVYGLSYGVSAFGYPLGAIAGVQGVVTAPGDQPVDPPISSDQFGAGIAPSSGAADSGTGDSGGAV